MQRVRKSLLFFDGASKGNPGAAGGGGVLYDPEGNLNLTYAWNLGIDSNNMAEALALWQGLSQAIRLGIQDLTVVGDSRLILHHLICRDLPSSSRLRQVIRRIFLLMPLFSSIEFFHVLRVHNEQADSAANESIAIGLGVLSINGVQILEPIP